MNSVIVVEGRGDQSFIEGFLAEIGKSAVKPFPPKELKLGVWGNGIDNLLKVIPLLINKIRAQDINQAGILVDADFAGENGGFSLRRQQITEALAKEGYAIPLPEDNSAGELFFHPNELAPIGLFIMPNHKDDGMLEDILKNMVNKNPYIQVLQHAKNVVQALNPKLFNDPLHISKAEIGTFLAWQKRPPADVKICLTNKIFDANTPAAELLKKWIDTVFV
jgi:hypothetical protein